MGFQQSRVALTKAIDLTLLPISEQSQTSKLDILLIRGNTIRGKITMFFTQILHMQE